MKKRWIYLLTALALAVGVCAAKPMTAEAAPTDPIDLEGTKGSMAIYPENPNRPEGQEAYGEDLKSAKVVVDVYKIADAVKTPGYDAYSYQFEGIYADAKLSIVSEPKAKDWQTLAQKAAQTLLLDEQNKMKTTAPEQNAAGFKETVTIESLESGEIKDLDAGLYLLIARGSDLEDAPDYYTVDMGEDKALGMSSTIATMASSPQYTYLFTPELISLPMRDPEAAMHPLDDEGRFDDELYGSTSDGTEWVYNLNVYLKPQRIQRFGPLDIEKVISLYEQEELEDGTIKKEPVTVVFTASWTLNAGTADEVSESRVTSLSFDAAGVKKARLDRIPAGVDVTVHEEYTGAGYQVVGERTKEVKIVADRMKNVKALRDANGNVSYLEGEIVTAGGVVVERYSPDRPAASVSFENEYSGRQVKGYGIRNQFTYDSATNEWVLAQNWIGQEGLDAGEPGSVLTGGLRLPGVGGAKPAPPSGTGSNENSGGGSEGSGGADE